jgi:hypothetical protein
MNNADVINKANSNYPSEVELALATKLAIANERSLANADPINGTSLHGNNSDSCQHHCSQSVFVDTRLMQTAISLEIGISKSSLEQQTPGTVKSTRVYLGTVKGMIAYITASDFQVHVQINIRNVQFTLSTAMTHRMLKRQILHCFCHWASLHPLLRLMRLDGHWDRDPSGAALTGSHQVVNRSSVDSSPTTAK